MFAGAKTVTLLIVTTRPVFSNRQTSAEAGFRPAAVLIDRFPYPGTVFGAKAIERLRGAFELLGSDLDGDTFRDNLDPYAQAEVLLGTWGLPALSKELLDKLPKLQAVFHGAGEYRQLLTEASAERGITFCSGIEINSGYVAHHVYATIINALKGAVPLRDQLRRTRDWKNFSAPRGLYGAKVGLIGLGRIGQLVSRQLQSLPIQLFAHDQKLPLSEFVSSGAVPASLSEIFTTCDIVSLHLPGGEATTNLIGRELLSSMKRGASLINTARGSVVQQSELVEVWRQRPDLTAYLDVCYPEPPLPTDPLYQLENCYLTPHLSGAIGQERLHLGDAMVDEAIRWKQGKKLQYGVHFPDQELSDSRLTIAAL